MTTENGMKWIAFILLIVGLFTGMTRAEYVGLMVDQYEATVGDVQVTIQNPFTDISGCTAEQQEDIILAYQLNITAGYGGGIFQPDTHVTVAQALILLGKTMAAIESAGQ